MANSRKQASGGEGGIRTHGTLAGTTVFETVPIDHSGTSPRREPGRYGVKGAENSPFRDPRQAHLVWGSTC